MKSLLLLTALALISSQLEIRAATPCVELHSLKSDVIFDKIDLSLPGLEAVKKSMDRGNHAEAFKALLAYYRKKFPPPPKSDDKGISKADDLVRHVFQWGPYEAADYGKEINWEWDPRGDIEWVAAVYRFYWARTLASAFQVTGDEKYAQTFVDFTRDWIKKHPLENHEQTHPVYTYWKGFPWLDIQTGIRATNLCRVFPIFVHAQCFTPEFLGVLLACLYDHQVKTERIPMNQIHNKAIFEQKGFINIAVTFPEFKEAQRWLKLALPRVEENLLAQTTPDGVQREWSGGYHLGVLEDAVEIMQKMEAAGIEISPEYRERVKKMYDYIFYMATPDLGFPMFGDTSRPIIAAQNRSALPLYRALQEASQLFQDSKYQAEAVLDQSRLPAEKSHAFSAAGMYAMRNDWGPEQIYLALHCSPPAISGHDQPDNGTFELYAYGRWLMPDTGFYTYGHDAQAREWHRQTRVHQTLTLDGQNSKTDAKELLWNISEKLEALVVENRSYKDLIHRRAVWFVDRQFFVILDDAIGSAAGALDLHYQFAPGKTIVNTEENWAASAFADANVLVWADPKAPVTLSETDGWFAWEYGSRKPRRAITYRHSNPAPATFLTLIVPYRGTTVPKISATLLDGHKPGADLMNIRVKYHDKTWEIGCDLSKNQTWCKEK